MLPQSAAFALLTACLLVASPSIAQDQNAGQADLDKATELKINAEGIKQVNQVIKLLESALDKGLDEDNADFAEELLSGSLMQRASAISAAVLQQPSANPRRNPQTLQLRLVALRDLQRVVDLTPTNADAYLLIGRLQSMRRPWGDPVAAREALSKVIEAPDVEPEKLAQAYALRSVTRTESSDRIADLDKAIEMQPKKLEFLLLRARQYQNSKQFDKAMVDVTKAIEMSPDSAAVRQLHAMILLSQDDLNGAIKSFNKASELAPQDIGSYQMRSQIFDRMGDTDKALEQLDKAIEMQPNNLATVLLRINLLIKGNRLEDALKDVDSLLKKQPGLVQAQMIRTQLLSQLNRDDEALAALEKLVEKLPRQPEVHLQLAAHYMDRQQPTKAIASLTKVLELAKDNQVALRLRGDMYLSTGEHSKALADFKKSYEINPNDSGLLNNYAWTLSTSPYDELRDGPRAVKIATKACELSDYKLPHILSTLAAAHAEAGDFDKAIEWSKKAVEMTNEGVEPDIDDELAKELASYKAGKPWRELQQVEDSATKDKPAEEKAEPADTPAPARTIDF